MTGFWTVVVTFVVGGVTFVPLLLILALAAVYLVVS